MISYVTLTNGGIHVEELLYVIILLCSVQVLGNPWNRQGQLFSIHAFVEKDGQSQQFPLAFAIMSRKTIADYNEAIYKDKMHFQSKKIQVNAYTD